MDQSKNGQIYAMRLALLLMGLCVSASAGAQDNESYPEDKIYIGILDDAREEMRNWKAGVPERRLIMPAFQKDGSDWLGIRSFLPRHMKWTVAFDGRNLGTVESQESPSDTGADQINSDNSRAKQEILTPSSEIPSVGKPSQKFAGVFSLGPAKFRRPLVVVSKPYFSDPDGWKRAQLPDEIAKVVLKGFRHQYPHVDRCKDEKIAEHDWKFPDSALAMRGAYRSNKNSFLVATHLDAGDCGWGGDPEDPIDTFVDQWFFVAADHSVRRIGGFDELLDAGDYDNCGSSEVIFFSMRSENSDAYNLVYDDFRKKAEIEVGYH